VHARFWPAVSSEALTEYDPPQVLQSARVDIFPSLKVSV
jgi:hypothetical protein